MVHAAVVRSEEIPKACPPLHPALVRLLPRLLPGAPPASPSRTCGCALGQPRMCVLLPQRWSAALPASWCTMRCKQPLCTLFFLTRVFSALLPQACAWALPSAMHQAGQAYEQASGGAVVVEARQRGRAQPCSGACAGLWSSSRRNLKKPTGTSLSGCSARSPHRFSISSLLLHRHPHVCTLLALHDDASTRVARCGSTAHIAVAGMGVRLQRGEP